MLGLIDQIIVKVIKSESVEFSGSRAVNRDIPIVIEGKHLVIGHDAREEGFGLKDGLDELFECLFEEGVDGRVVEDEF